MTTTSQIRKIVNEVLTNRNSNKLNESGGSYQMYHVMKNELQSIGKAYERYESESLYNFGAPIEDNRNPSDSLEWSTREAKIEILEEVLNVLNKYSDYADEDIIIK